MNQEHDDGDLRIRFHELRDEVTESVPPFAVPRSPGIRPGIPVWSLAAVGAAAGLALLLWSGVARTGQNQESVIDLGIVAWTAPSDFLLDTPGRGLLRTIPTINSEGLTPANFGPDESVTDTSG